MQSKYWVRGLAAAVLGVALSAPASAATIFGTLTQQGKPVAKAHLTLSCAGLATPAETQTDDRGSYHFSVATKGSCKLSYAGGSVKAETDVIIDPHPTQYDFDLDAGKDGARLVRR
jgi:hypothetical protein